MRTSRVRAGPWAVEARHHEPVVARGRVVVVHGMVVAGRATDPLGRALAERGLAVHVPDQPGFGRSDKPRRALDVDGLALAVGDWMEAAGLAPAAVLGNSFGTQVAAALAVARPDLVTRLALVSPTIDARYRRVWTRLLGRPRPVPADARPAGGAWRAALVHRLVPVTPAPPPALRGLLWREYLAAGPLRALATYRHALLDDLPGRLAGLRVPLLVVRAGRDGVVSPRWAAAVAAAGRGRLTEVAGIGHDAQFECPGPLAAAVAGWLAGDDQVSRTPPPATAAASSSDSGSGDGRARRGRAARRASR